MTRDEIYDLLKLFFNEYPVRISNNSTWSKILITNNLEVYTYSGYCDREDSIWYFNLYFNGYGKEIMRPNKDSNEFIQGFKEIYLDVVKANSLFDSVNDRLSKISDASTIRDIKINNIINYD
jgi:hypothetical protein